MDLKQFIRDVPNYPVPGILFKDITPLLKNPGAFKHVIDYFYNRCSRRRLDGVVGIEARGFIFAAPLAYRLEKPLVPARKKGKLPAETFTAQYALEYGTNTVEMHKDAILAGQRVVIVDDLLATGGTMAATCKLVEQAGGEVDSLLCLIELTELNGRSRLSNYDVFSIVQY